MPRRILRVATKLSFVRALRWVLWGLLALAAGLTIFPSWLVSRVEAGVWPRTVLLLPALVFGVFIAVFAVYRLALVRAGRYSAGKAFIQTGLGVLVLILLARPGFERYRMVAGGTEQVDLRPLLQDPDPVVRVAACEALAHRTSRTEREAAAALAASDPDPRVRKACARVE